MSPIVHMPNSSSWRMVLGTITKAMMKVRFIGTNLD